MERNMRLNEDVLRHMSVRLEEPSKGQSKILDKNHDDDAPRGDRDGGEYRPRPRNRDFDHNDSNTDKEVA
jgi:small subunit ribosomal protein S6